MKGIYCLILNVKENLEINIGSLKTIKFEKGNYVYVGSAMNNLEKRINRHLKKEKNIHWHIDYLNINKNVEIIKTISKELPKEYECKIANLIKLNSIAIEKFGCSDCKCISHLFKINDYTFIEEIFNSINV